MATSTKRTAQLDREACLQRDEALDRQGAARVPRPAASSSLSSRRHVPGKAVAHLRPALAAVVLVAVRRRVQSEG